MFRKPKKKPAALRGGPSGSGGTINNTASTNNKRRRRASSSSEDEDNNDGNEEGTSDLLQQIRQERDDAKSSKSGDNKKLLNTSSTASSSKKMKMHQYKSNDVQLSAQEQATRTGEYHPTSDKQSANNGDNNNDDAAAAASSQNAQIAALQKQTRNKFLAGPIKATTFVRTTTRFDYQPDICKDYKETGFCGFGDTCIYLHDRGDTKSGWQMEQEYEEKKKREEEKKGKEMEAFMQSMMCGEVGTNAGDGGGGLTTTTGGGNGKDDKSFNTDDGIPFACHICRGPFNSPIVTTCGHYFCEKCMQSRVREVGSGCPICQKDTHGVLNYAQKLVAKKRRLVGRDGTWEEYLERSKKGSDGDVDE